jgi:hypothetical protein
MAPEDKDTDQDRPPSNELQLGESALLYAEVYAEDIELRLLAQQAIEEWPE